MTMPFENENRNIIRKLVRSSLRTEKRRNLMAAVAIALAAYIMMLGGTIFTALFTAHSDQMIDTYQAMYSGLTSAQIQALRERPEVEEVGVTAAVGPFHQAAGYDTAFLWMDNMAAAMMEKQISIDQGEFPRTGSEIAVPQEFLMTQESSGTIGSNIALDINGTTHTFTICGILNIPCAQGSYTFLLSQEALMALPGAVQAGYQASVCLSGGKELDQVQAKQILEPITEELGLSQPALNMQALADANTPSSESVLLLPLLGALILIGGGVVIRSIFQISVNHKIRMYGQLRTIGATRRQIRHMVRREGTYLALAGVPTGIVLGGITGFCIMPQAAGVIGYLISAAVASLVAVIMVRLSLRTPVRIAAGTSPIEAVHFIPEQGHLGKGRKLHRSLKPLNLAVMNLGRDKKKTAGILFSLCFGGLLLLVSASLLSSYSPEVNARMNFRYGDFKIYLDISEDNMVEQMMNGNPLTDELRSQILAIDGVKDVVLTRSSIGGRFSADFQPDGSGMCDLISDDERTELEKILTSGRLPENSREILVVFPYEDCQPGDTMELTLDGMTEPVQVTVSGTIDLYKYHMDNDWLGMDGPLLAIPASLAHEMLPGIQDFSYTWEVVTDAEQDGGIEPQLESLIRDQGLSMYTFQENADAYASQWNTVLGGAQAFSWLLFLFGVINLINVMLSNQLSRRMEVSVMRSVGLTRKQLYRMMLAEGLLYVLISTGIMLAVGVPLSAFICRELGVMMYQQAMDYVFPIWPVLAYVLTLLAVQMLLSLSAIRSLKKKPLVEQLRETE